MTHKRTGLSYDLVPASLVAPDMRYCAQCARPAVFLDGIAELASYICPLRHLTLLDLTELKQQHAKELSPQRMDSRRRAPK
jgi:hypothetical protein